MTSTKSARLDSAIDRRCAQRAEDVFKKLVESAPAQTFTGPVHFVADDQTALQGRPEGGRACACAEVHPGRAPVPPEGYVYVTWRFLTRFSANQQEGVLRHELAHVALLMAGDENHSERDADKKALDLWGKKIKYDAQDIQTIGAGVSPRPARLDAGENPSASECIQNPDVKTLYRGEVLPSTTGSALERWQRSLEKKTGWTVTNLDVNQTTGAVRLTLRQGIKEILLDRDALGRCVVEENAYEKDTTPVGRKGDRFLAERLRGRLVWREKPRGMRAALRLLGDAIGDRELIRPVVPLLLSSGTAPEPPTENPDVKTLYRGEVLPHVEDILAQVWSPELALIVSIEDLYKFMELSAAAIEALPKEVPLSLLFTRVWSTFYDTSGGAHHRPGETHGWIEMGATSRARGREEPNEIVIRVLSERIYSEVAPGSMEAHVMLHGYDERPQWEDELNAAGWLPLWRTDKKDLRGPRNMESPGPGMSTWEAPGWVFDRAEAAAKTVWETEPLATDPPEESTENPAPEGALTTVKQHETLGPVTWEYIGTVDALDTRHAHPVKHFTSWYYGVPRVETEGFGTTTWDVWVPRKKRGTVGYTDKQIEKWQTKCPHRFHDDALEVMAQWEAKPARPRHTRGGLLNPTPLAKRHPFPTADELFFEYEKTREAFDVQAIALGDDGGAQSNRLTLDDIVFFLELVNLMYEAAPEELPTAQIRAEVFARAPLFSDTIYGCDCISISRSPRRLTRGKPRASRVEFFFDNTTDENNAVFAYALPSNIPGSDMIRSELESAGWVPIVPRLKTRGGRPRRKAHRYGIPARIAQNLSLVPDGTGEGFQRDAPGWKKCRYCGLWLTQASPPYAHEWVDGNQNEECRVRRGPHQPDDDALFFDEMPRASGAARAAMLAALASPHPDPNAQHAFQPSDEADVCGHCGLGLHAPQHGPPFQNPEENPLTTPVIQLRDYLTMNDEYKLRDIAYSFSYDVARWAEEHDLAFDEDAGDIDPFVDTLDEKQKRDLFETLKAAAHDAPADEQPSWLMMDFIRLVKQEWLVHFSDDASNVSAEGLNRGVDDFSRLGLTRHMSESAKKRGGFNFAFLAKNAADYALRGPRTKYGKHAVMFRANGVLVDHYGDNERQVVFWGETANSVVLLMNGGDGWEVEGRSSQRAPFVSKDSGLKGLQACVEWVQQNYDQYRKALNQGANKNPSHGAPFNVTEWADSYAKANGLHRFDVYTTTVAGDDTLYWKLNYLSVVRKEHGQGRGTAAMEALCKHADAHSATILLNLMHRSVDTSVGTTSRARLVRFYKRFGFVENRGRRRDFRLSAEMVRVPGGDK